MSARAERGLSLRGTLRRSPRLAERRIWGAACDVALADLADGTALGGALPALAGRSVLLRVARSAATRPWRSSSSTASRAASCSRRRTSPTTRCPA